MARSDGGGRMGRQEEVNNMNVKSVEKQENSTVELVIEVGGRGVRRRHREGL